MKKLKLEELDRLSIEEYKQSEKLPVIVVLDNVRSAHNVGAFFRTCDATAVSKLVLCGITAVPPHKEINKAAIGATNSVDWEYFEDAESYIESLDKDNVTFISVEQTDVSLNLQELRKESIEDKTLLIVFGNEVDGVSEKFLEQSDFAISIPQYGTKHSFNVSVCGGIVLWEVSKLLRY